MQTHDVKRKTKLKKSKIVGRGGLRGKTSGKGHKGQKARAGGTPRPEMRDIIKKLPKLRGHGKNRSRTVNSGRAPVETVTLAVLEANFESGSKIRPKTLADLGLIKTRAGKTPKVKILGQGDIAKSLVCYDCEVSATAQEKIEKAGGKVINK
ncbi:MAG: large subunit ribosomal protein L15 [Candidatus Paceibacteria bacterium]|jgi:large subunit ribosomal protein L15